MGFRAPKWFREEIEAEERKREEKALQPVREAEAQLRESHRRLADFQRQEVLAGRSDPEWQTPQSARTLKMPVSAAKKFVAQQAELFVSQNPDYHPTRKNLDTIFNYLDANHVQIPTAECFALAWQRLRTLGMVEQRPEPEPQPIQPEPELIEAEPQEELIDGWDTVTGEPRKYTQAEVWRMSSGDMRRAFRMWADRDADRRPRLIRNRF